MSKQTPKKLGLWMLTALVAGNMIGSGIFLLPASLASYGSISLIAWGFTAFGAMLLALVFANLAGHFPKVGGPYAYCRDAFGEFIGFEVAFNYWIALWVGNAGIAVAFVSYLAAFIPSLAHNATASFVASVATVWGLTLINIIGVRSAGQVQLITTILKLLPLLLLAFVGVFYIDGSNLADFNISGESNWAALTGAASLTLWSFIGVESATVPADDVDEPQKNIPRATILGTLITAAVYILSTIAVMGLVPASILAQSSAPYADAAEKVFGHWGFALIAFGGMVSCFGALNGWILLQGQVARAAADDDLFPSVFARLSKQHTPVAGLIISSILITILLVLTINANLVTQFTFIIRLATLATLIPYLLSTMAQILLFCRQREAFNKAQFIRSSVIAALAFLYSFWAVSGSGQEIVFYGALLFFAGTPVYVWMKWQKTLPQTV